VELGGIEQCVLFQLLAHQRQREFGAVNRRVQIAENVGDGANVIFVRVRQDDAAHHVLVLLQVRDIGNHDIHAKQLLLGKHQSRVDDENVIAISQDHHVHAEFAEPAQRDGPQ
jgi:hypothetical protein